MDIVLFIALITVFACVGVCSALLYRGWELSREGTSEHGRMDDAIRTYAGHAEDGIDRMLKKTKRYGMQVWQSQCVPFGMRVKRSVIIEVENFAPTAYLMRVYRAIRGLHATQGEEEDRSSFLREVSAHKSASEREDSSLDTENTKTPM